MMIRDKKEQQMEQEVSLIDVHAHLDEVSDLSEALQEARAAGVRGIIAVGVHLDSNKKVLTIAEGNRGFVYPALGYHPWEIRQGEIEGCLSFIRDHIQECVALGEIGLDYKVKVKKELQWEVFGKLLDIAREHQKPVIIHCRYSHRRALEMVKERKLQRAVFHWYTGPLELLEQLLAMGYFISATPALQYSPIHQEAIKRAPLEGILLETDTPVSYGGKEARPKDVCVTMQEVARLKETEPVTVARKTTINAARFFQLPLRCPGEQG
ncbi:MAG: hypothetical protein DRG50_03725 [Deltaproteobacteria bacterium]|nr:MAG: hypothetical protein DRG50_03725 [Deltaproteobacteria bacterium]